MVIDPTKPLLRLTVGEQQGRHPGKQDKRRRPDPLPKHQQTAMFGPRFERLRTVLERDEGALELRSDPTSMAPERLMVFEVQGPVRDFIKSLELIDGLSLVDEDELEADEGITPHLYLLVPDMQALKEIESLWRRWTEGQALDRAFDPWINVFKHLRTIRVWGPQDRLGTNNERILTDEIVGKSDDDTVILELELVYRPNAKVADGCEDDLRASVTGRGGTVVSRARLPNIGYHALLVRVPVAEVRGIIDLSPESLAGQDQVMFICPQSIATRIEVSEPVAGGHENALPEGDAIVALLDGVPVARHPVLAGRLNVEDLFGLEDLSQVHERSHGTAMASLITRGDLNINQSALPRPVTVIPLLGRGDNFPPDRLVVDLVYEAVQALFAGDEPLAPHVLLINLSLGNRNCQFDRKMSAWARLLDRISYEHDVLFVVSAGNHDRDLLPVPNFANWVEFEDSEDLPRAENTLRGVHARVGFRRLLSPSESINALSIGASNGDAIPDHARRSIGVDPYQDRQMPNPSSALGPGFGNSVKPDLLFPGGREHVRMANSGGGLTVAVCGPSHAHGLKVAAPGVGDQTPLGFSGNTSGATALATRTCHQIHDALEEAYGEAFLRIPKSQRVPLLKALLVHTASWPASTSSFLQTVMGPEGRYLSARRKDNARRMLGYGFADPERAISCVDDRATFWAVGTLGIERGREILVPIPASFGAQARPHSISATLAWITPVAAGRKSYRNIRLQLEDPGGIGLLGVKATGQQPDISQGRRGTVFSRTWLGAKAAVVGDEHVLPFWVQRTIDQADDDINDDIPFAVAITIEMPGVNTIYSQVEQRVQDRARART